MYMKTSDTVTRKYNLNCSITIFHFSKSVLNNKVMFSEFKSRKKRIFGCSKILNFINYDDFIDIIGERRAQSRFSKQTICCYVVIFIEISYISLLLFLSVFSRGSSEREIVTLTGSKLPNQKVRNTQNQFILTGQITDRSCYIFKRYEANKYQ